MQWNYREMAILDHDHSEFIGVDALINENANQLVQFRKFAENRDWYSFHSSHYDWWAFPIGSPSSYGYRYSVSKESVVALKLSPKFLSNLSECADLLMLSWGWDAASNKPLAHVDSGQAWARWPIRLYKAWRSMQIFGLLEKEVSLSTYAHYLRETGVSFQYQGRDLFDSITFREGN
jgi:hypothetical protein